MTANLIPITTYLSPEDVAVWEKCISPPNHHSPRERSYKAIIEACKAYRPPYTPKPGDRVTLVRRVGIAQRQDPLVGTVVASLVRETVTPVHWDNNDNICYPLTANLQEVDPQ